MESSTQAVDMALVIQQRALAFVVLMGVVSLLADMVYEGGRSIAGPYLALLGASGTVVGLAAGFGELIGYGLRLIFGYLSDRTHRYWAFTIAGYALTALAVPALALVGNWQLAAVFLTIERISKALRTPSKDTLLAYATTSIGHGKGFGLHEVLDQIGAVTAPLLLAAVIAWQGNYRLAFALLLIPGVLTIVVLLVARARFPQPENLASKTPALTPGGFSRVFWLYLGAVGLIAAGFADFPLIAFHLLFGLLFDRVGFRALILAALLSAGFAPLAFSSASDLVVLGMVLWGIGMGAQESILRAAVAGMAPPERRGTAYGLFNTGYGLCWFAGSALMGLLYDQSLPALIAVSVALQLVAVSMLVLMSHRRTV